MKAAAFFDMDRTLLRCNSGTLYIRWLRKHNEISLPRMIQALGWIAQYKLSVLDMESIVAREIAKMAGQSEAEMYDKCLAFFDAWIRSEVAPKGEDAIARHRRDGHVLAILSTSTPYVVEPLARHVGIDHVLCTRLSVREGRFDGTHVRPACYGLGKVHWAEEFARRHEVDLTRSFFYTDSYSDLPMLERVGMPRIINPDTRLRRHARKAGWPVDEW
jgi:HAD superfamily hydrolase (TIGR01490 family)